MHSPYVGTISDSEIEIDHKKNSLDERGTDFNLNLISGMFEMNHHIGKKMKYGLQKTGRCRSSKLIKILVTVFSILFIQNYSNAEAIKFSNCKHIKAPIAELAT